jgi:hypothetical protein
LIVPSHDDAVVHDNRCVLERILLWPGRVPLRADWEGLAGASRICLDRRAAGVARYSDTRCYVSVLCPGPTRFGVEIELGVVVLDWLEVHPQGLLDAW